MKKRITAVMAIFCVLVLGITIFMDQKSSREQRTILEESIKSQLISICSAAREIVSGEELEKFGSLEDVAANQAEYDAILEQLRILQKNVGAEYVYVLRQIDGETVFVFDTDEEDTEIFIPYDLSEVHAQAFAGREAADVLNVVDEYGSFNTGAVPIWHNGNIVGVVSTDIEDELYSRSMRIQRLNSFLLIGLLAVILAAMLVVMARLMSRLKQLQQKLEHMAHYDNVTGLPNRQYLMEYLSEITGDDGYKSFAILFIDLDNFKQVNDNAGHDAGDELLRNIAQFLNDSQHNVRAFRPAPGQLNVAARIGGDEFIQVVPGVDNVEAAAEAAEHLLQGFAKHNFGRYVEKYKVGFSIGVALYPFHSDNYHVLIKYADIAMYHAKHAGKNSYRVYSDEMKGKDEK